MSVRSSQTNKSAQGSSSSAIDFKSEFVNSTAAFAASHDQTVNHILSRLDQLQSKISTQPEPSQAPTRVAAQRQPPAASDLNARLSVLEDVHENALQRLSSRFENVERKLTENKEAEGLMSQIVSKFAQVESKLHSATLVSDRVAKVEAKLQSKIAELESRLKPDPEQERLLTRINAKLDRLEETGGMAAKRVEPTLVGAERTDRINYLQDRITKLNELKAKYQAEAKTLS
jgi:hypothetical protein